MAVQYAPLFALETQFQAKNGRNLTGGFLRVFYAATDDPADTYSDYNLTRNPDRIVLDDNGRALVICDKSKAYRLEVYDINGMLLWTEEPVYCSGTGGGGVSITKVISTDGSIAIDESVAGSTTTYDIGLAPRDSDEFLEWIKCSEEDCGSTWYPVYQEGTMETEAGQGLHVGKDRFYHITCSFKVYPKGDGINYETLVAKLMFNDGEDHQVTVRGFDIDNSVHDPLLCEFSYDFKAPEDGYLFLDIDGASAFTMVDCELQVHRIYSGINAVPDTCATKPFVSANYQPLSGMSAYVNYSAISGNSDNQITGINGSSIAANMDTASLTSTFVTTSVFNNYAFNTDNTLIDLGNSVSSLSSTVSGLTGTYLEQSASALFAPSGDYAYNSSISGKVDQSAFDNCCSSMSSTVSALETSVTAISSNVSGLTGVYLEQSASSLFQPSGDYAYNSALSGKLDTSAFSGVSGNFVQNSAFTSYTASALTAIDNSISSIQSSMSSMSSDVSGKVDQSSMSAWIPYSALDYSGTAISGIGGSSLAGMGGGGADYTGIYPINVDNTAREIAVDSLPLVTDSSMTSYASGDSSVIGVNLDIMSGKLDKTAQVVTATATQLYAGTAYLTSVNGAPVSASRAGNAANASLANSAYYDGTGRLISSLPDSATVSAIASAYTTGKQDTLTFSYYDDKISAINGSALAGQGGGGATGDYVEKSALDVGIGSGNYSLNTSFTQGELNTAKRHSFAQGFSNSASGTSFAQGRTNTSLFYSFAQGSSNSASSYSFAQGWANSAVYHSFAQGFNNSAKNTVAVFGEYNLHGDGSTSTGNSAAFAIGDGTDATARHDLMLVTKDGEITMYSSTADTSGTGIMSSIRAISAAATGKQDSSAMSAYLPFSAISADENSAITSINGSSIGGGTQLVTATGSASVYGTGINTINGSSIIAKSLSAGGLIVGYSDPGMYITGGNNGGTAYYKSNELVINRSGYGETIKFNLGSAGSQIYGSATGSRGAFMQMSNDNHTAFFGALSGGDAKIELDGYSAGSANMAGWDSTWGTVSSQSANWGGSALELSAGPGVTLTKSGNTLIAGLDETVIWNNSAWLNGGDANFGVNTGTMSDYVSAFERIRVHFARSKNANLISNTVAEFDPGRIGVNSGFLIGGGFVTDAFALYQSYTFVSVDGLNIAEASGGQWTQASQTWSKDKVYVHPFKIVGINRI